MGSANWLPTGIGDTAAVASLLARSASFMPAGFAWNFDDLEDNTLGNWAVAGPVVDATHGFGVWSAVNAVNQFIQKATTVVANPSVTPWHVAGRIRIATAPGGADVKTVALDNQATVDRVRVGLNGPVSTAKFVFSAEKAGVLVSALSTVNLDITNFHVCEIWFDGVNMWGSVDGEAPVLVTTAASLPTVLLTERTGINLGAGAVLGIYIDFLYAAAARTAT